MLRHPEFPSERIADVSSSALVQPCDLVCSLRKLIILGLILIHVGRLSFYDHSSKRTHLQLAAFALSHEQHCQERSSAFNQKGMDTRWQTRT
jgi:hypothetical protein